ncbi:hypothetical protein F5146DRAFT_1106274 [Armillaria mellea]|nr:hypothetical protein F5146DRAFT_1106274 [Armillaria mellea]
MNWRLEEIMLTGDCLDGEGNNLTERLELWYQDPVDCIHELMGNPMFCDVMKYTPEKLFSDLEGSTAVINEMWTVSWWWDLQIQKYLPAGATIIPVILSSDKTKLSQFHGDKSAWPVYLTIGNISKDVHRDVTSHATVLIGYLSIGKFDCYMDKTCSLAQYHTFHYAIEVITQSLAEAGKESIPMTCADGCKCWAWPILAAYVVDYPEQCLIACCKENRCPICTVSPQNRGSHMESAFCTHKKNFEMLQKLQSNTSDPVFKEDWESMGIWLVVNPFWRHLPFSNIFQSFTLDLLHQLHKGMFKDHLVKWCSQLISEQDMTGHPGLHHFKNGISNVSQWTGAEHKAMEQVFVGLIMGAVDKYVLMAVRAVVDFIYFALLHSHMSSTLTALSQALDNFHNADGFNTESPKCLHIDYAKDAYRASNKCDYIAQMTTWLHCQKAMDCFADYLHWCQNGTHLTVGPTDEEDNFDGDASFIGDPRTAKYSLSLLPQALRSKSQVQVAHTHPPDLTHIPAQKIINRHHVTCFLEALTGFLHDHGCLMTPMEFNTFNLYRRLIIILPPIPEAGTKAQDLKNIVCHHAGEAAHLDCALVCTGERNDRTAGTALEGLRVTHIHVLFALPSIFGVKHQTPLVYVEWFTPFLTPDPHTGLYTLTWSTCQHQVYVQVIEASRIIQNCHLQLKYGWTKDPMWTTDNVMDLCHTFYFNAYWDLHLFSMLRVHYNKKLWTYLSHERKPLACV